MDDGVGVEVVQRPHNLPGVVGNRSVVKGTKPVSGCVCMCMHVNVCVCVCVCEYSRKCVYLHLLFKWFM